MEATAIMLSASSDALHTTQETWLKGAFLRVGQRLLFFRGIIRSTTAGPSNSETHSGSYILAHLMADSVIVRFVEFIALNLVRAVGPMAPKDCTQHQG